MARKYQWSKDKYISLVKGDSNLGIESLRTIFRGFDNADGFNVKRFDKWTPSMRKKVRSAFHRLEVLQAQPKRMVRARGGNLRKLQESFHGDVSSRDMKVAFIPDTEPQLTMPGAKRHPPKLRMLKEGIAIERANYTRIFIPFDQKRLVRSAKDEVARVAKRMPNARLFYVQVGEYQTLNGKSIGLVTDQILKWMQQYDGKRELPAGSGNKGDDPRHHHWKHWLNGLVGYELHRTHDVRQVGKIIREGIKKNEELVRKRRNYFKRQGRKGKGK